jgi:hypothetical protein
MHKISILTKEIQTKGNHFDWTHIQVNDEDPKKQTEITYKSVTDKIWPV